MINALSIDLEYWHSAEFVSDHASNIIENQIEKSVVPILDLLDKYDVKATFFVLGVLAENNPSIVKMVHEKGHEIASHCYSHKPLHVLGKKGFENELKKSIEILEGITKEEVIGFRAPSFSVNNSTRWAFEMLEKAGIRYDSSVFPIETSLYGVPDAPLQIYNPSINDIALEDPDGMIVEFPLSTVKLFRNIPISGGFYFRLLPYWFVKFAIKKINLERPAIIYLHPWETSADTPRLNLPLTHKFVTYYGLRNTLKKFEKILQDFKFAPVREVLEL